MRRVWFFLLLSLGFVKCDISHVNLLQFENVTIPDINTICSYFRTAPNVSEECAGQLEIACGNSDLYRTMFDASSKFPYTGLGSATRMDYGSFDQCLSVDHSYEGGRILGEYCLIGLVVPDVFSNLSDKNSYYKLAVCRPNACMATDYNAIIMNLTSLPFEFFQDYECQTTESYSTFSDGDIIVLTIFAIFSALMTLSTMYDIFLYFNKSKSFHPLLLSFSVLSNGKKLIHISKHTTSKDQIEIFHGFRVISMMWIVAGHGISMWELLPVTNAERINTWQQEMYAVYLAAGHLAVDTFFFMSGFLLAFQYFKGKIKTLKQQLISVPHIVIHRYIRITPAMLMVYLVVITFFVHIASGPLWIYLSESNTDLCKKQWWKFFLYIQNYGGVSDICVVQTWYLSADMQLFILSPLVLIPLSLQLKSMGFKPVMLSLLVWNIFWTFLPMTTKLMFSDHVYEYDTHSRVINYYIGVMLGVFMRLRINEPFLYMINEGRRYIINLVTWIAILLGMLVTVICYQDQSLHYGYNSRSVFDALMRPAWCIGLSWITYSCYHGRGGFINWILCRPIFQILGRLTYCMYLIHGLVIFFYAGTIRTRLYFNDYTVFYQFCGHYIMSVVVAACWTLAFESPLMIIEKYFFGGARKSEEPPVSHRANGEKGA